MEKTSLVFPIKGHWLYLGLKHTKVGAGRLNGWGGKLKPEDGGDMAVCACREVKEESSAVLKRDYLILAAVVDFFMAGVHVFECYVYLSFQWEGEFQATEEMGRGQKFPLTNPPYESMMPADAVLLPAILDGRQRRWAVYYGENNEAVEKIDDLGPLT